MTMIMVMSKVNVFEVKAKLSEYLERAARGERIVICRHNRPIAELRAVGDVRTEPRPIGPLPGRPTFDVPASFFEPLSLSELDLWDRVSASDPLAAEGPRSGARSASRVAESPKKYTRGRRGVRRRP
jgi:antitoxin (DNA-binding transcriptional repressor) of toxin-antitoxin stability system